MRYLFIAFLFISSFVSGQGIEPTSFQPTQYQGGILRGVIPYVDEFTGETLYIYQHVDSLVFIKDSIYVRNDSIFLRDGTGFAVVTDSLYVIEGATKDTIKLRDGDGYVLMDKQSQSRVRGTGTATRVAWWGGTDSLSSDADLYWDDSNKRLGIGTTSPNSRLDVNKSYTNPSDGNIVLSGSIPILTWRGSKRFAIANNYVSGDALTILGTTSANSNPTTQLMNIYNYGYTEIKDSLRVISTLRSGTNGGEFSFGTNDTKNPDNAQYFINLAGGKSYRINANSSLMYVEMYTPSSGQNRNFRFATSYFNNGDFNLLKSTTAGGTPLSPVWTINDNGMGVFQQNPSAYLHVGGDFKVDTRTGTATTTAGFTNEGKLVEIAGVLSGSGTTNYIPKWTPNSSTLGNSVIYNTDSLVGINQSNPQFHLDVNGKFRVSQRTGTAATGAGFTADGQLVTYNLDTAFATPNTYIESGTNISITGAGTMADPYTINNTNPENTSVKDGTQIDFTELTNDTITATIITGSIGSTELASSGVTAGSYNLLNATIDVDGRITSATSGSAVTSIATTSPITGGTITNTGTIGINNAAADGSTKGAAAFTVGDFDSSSGLISLDYTNGQAASGSLKGFLTSADWTTFNNKIGGSGASPNIAYFTGSGTLSSTSDLSNQTSYLYTGYDEGIHIDGSSASYASGIKFRNSGYAHCTFGMKGASFVFANTSTNHLTLWPTPTDRLLINMSSGVINIPNLAGSGNRMVISSSTGDLSTQTIPTGTVTSVGLTAGTGISVSGSPITSSGNITVTNTGVTSLNGLGGSMFLSTTNSGTYPNWFSSGTTLYFAMPSGSSGQVLKHNGTGWTAGTDNNTDAQTLSFSSPNLSISGGNSVALPVLPSGSTPGNGIRWTGSAWEASTLMSIAANAASTKYLNWNGGNSYLGGSGISTSGNIHLVAGGSGVSAARLMGQDASDALTGVAVGSGLSLSSGTLSYSPVYAEVSYIGPSSAITTWTSIPWNQTAVSNGMSTSSSGITIPTTGNYRIDYSVQGAFSNNTLTGYSGMSCRVFSAGTKGTRTEKVYHSNTQTQDLTISHQSIWANLSAGTVVYIEVDDATTSGSTLTITAANLIVTKL